MSRPPGEVVRFRIALLLMNGILAGHHVSAGPRSNERFVKAEARVLRVERSESLDEREASARIDDVMAVQNFAVS
jgi:hypothetical protein